MSRKKSRRTPKNNAVPGAPRSPAPHDFEREPGASHCKTCGLGQKIAAHGYPDRVDALIAIYGRDSDPSSKG